MLRSFLKHNRWFRGDIVVIHDDLKPDHQEYLADCYEQIHFLRASAELLKRISHVTEARPDFLSKRARFFSLEAFRLRTYDKVLFCDSDLLFRQSVCELFKLPQPFVACGDGAHYQGRGRHYQGTGRLDNTFNAGVLMIDRTLLTDNEYHALLELVCPATYRSSSVNLTDQVAFNLHLAGRQYLAGATYNYLLAHRGSIYEREGLGLMDARVIHFNGEHKPWTAGSALRAAQHDPVFVKACGLWLRDYVECVQRLSLQVV
jgi:lipopolysaccharide biosynthesis glycosyltransferase